MCSSDLRAHPQTHSVFPFGETIHVAGAGGVVDAGTLATGVIDALRAHGFADADATPIEPSVEDVFIDLMGAAPVPATVAGTASRVSEAGV